VIEGITAASEKPAAEEAILPSLSATRAADLASGRVALADALRPLPERPSAARRIGTEVHRWVEERSRGLMGLADEEELSEPSGYVEPSRISEMKKRFDEGWRDRPMKRLESGEPMAELPFVLKVGERLVRGRIDAVYETDDGGLEIVDFKTGQQVEAEGLDQLQVYAAALAHLGVEFTGSLTLTYAYLSDGDTDSRTISAEEAAAALDRLEEQLGAVASPSG
jgi:DNA helicase-2/ATP-dependent DNA helicase PcrA